MKNIDRVAIVVKFKEPYLTWVRSLEEDSSIDDIPADELGTVYLVEVLGNYRPQKLLRQVFSAIFEEQLRAWQSNEADWPKDRSFWTFHEWFDVSVITVVFDFGQPPPPFSRAVQFPKPKSP